MKLAAPVAIGVVAGMFIGFLLGVVITRHGKRADVPRNAAPTRVDGIGGVFFRARDPHRLSAWYEDTLGISRVPKDYSMQPWKQRAGPTIFAPFPRDTEYFGNPQQAWMINFRVGDLDAMVAQLRARGIEVKVDSERYPNGRFARLTDPEGNPIELWEPKEPNQSPQPTAGRSEN